MADIDLLTITEEEYNRWIPPRIALQRLASITRALAVDAISTRLSAGTMRMVAATIGQGENNDHFVVLNARRLNKHALNGAFWTTGDLTITPDKLVDAEYRHARVPATGHTVHMVGIRFDPDAIAEIERQAGIVETNSSETAEAATSPTADFLAEPAVRLRQTIAKLEAISNPTVPPPKPTYTPMPRPLSPLPKASAPKSPLPVADRQRFAKLYVEIFGDRATETKALLAVRASYPDNFVSRDAFLEDFRAIRGRQPRGRKGNAEK